MIQALRRRLTENRTLLWVCLVIAVNQLGFGIVVPVLPIYAATFGVSEAAIGLVVAVFGLGRFLFNMPAGQAADRWGRKRVIWAGTAITAIGSVLCGFATTYAELLAFRFVSGIGAAIVITGTQIVVADLATRENRGRMMSTYFGFFIFAVGFGPTPGGIIADAFGPRSPFFAFALLTLLAGLIALWRLPETRGLREAREAAAAAAPVPTLGSRAAMRLLLANVGFVTVSFVTFVQFFNRTGAIFTVVPLAGVERLGLDASAIGFAITIGNMSNLAIIGIVGVMVDRYGRKPVIVPGCLITGLAFVGFAFADGYVVYVVCSVLWGLGTAIGASAASAYAADQAPPGGTGVTMGIARTLSDAGYVIGPALLGVVAATGGTQTALLFAAGLSLAAALPFALLAPESYAARRAQPLAR